MGNINNPGGTHTYNMFTTPDSIPGGISEYTAGTANNMAGGTRAEPIAHNVDYSTSIYSDALNIPNQVMGLLVSGLTFMKIDLTLNGQPIFERQSMEGELFGARMAGTVIERIQYCKSVQGQGRWVLLNNMYMDNGIPQCCGGTFDCSTGGYDRENGEYFSGGTINGDSPVYAWADKSGTDNLNTMMTKGLKGGLQVDSDTYNPVLVGIQPYYSNMRTHTKNTN